MRSETPVRKRTRAAAPNPLVLSEQEKRRHMRKTIIELCADNGLRLTEQRRIIAGVLEDARDHPDAEELYARASQKDSSVSLATVYRTLKLFEDNGILEKHVFGDGRSRYEIAGRAHHDHLIDLDSGKVIEFVEPEIEELQERIAAKLGYRITGHRLELYGVKIDD
jgi:Fur family ferric uptake transcriptional regulator